MFRQLGSLALAAGMIGPLTAPLPATAQAPTPPILGLADSVFETFHDSDADMCDSRKVHIDSPVRAFEDQNHVIHLTVSDPNATGWQWTGSVNGFTNRPTTARLDCTPVMTGNVGNTDIPSFDQKTWIQGLYFSSPTVYAYGHEDYFGTRTSEPECHRAGTTDGLPSCWYSSVAVWRATVPASGTHLAFARTAAAPNHVAIYPQVRYPGHDNTPRAGWIGYGTPSNIIRGRNPDGSLDGFSYMLAYASAGYAGQAKGVCLFRNPDPSVPGGWRAWNGSIVQPAFTQQMGNPYNVTTNSPCATVFPGTFTSPVRSLQWHQPSRHYIAIFRDSGAVRYATSPDLLSWNDSRVLLVSEPAAANYPVVIDFDGGDRGDDNFDRIHSAGKTYLFYRKSIEFGHTRITRRLIAVTNYPADPPAATAA